MFTIRQQSRKFDLMTLYTLKNNERSEFDKRKQECRKCSFYVSDSTPLCIPLSLSWYCGMYLIPVCMNCTVLKYALPVVFARTAPMIYFSLSLFRRAIIFALYTRVFRLNYSNSNVVHKTTQDWADHTH